MTWSTHLPNAPAAAARLGSGVRDDTKDARPNCLAVAMGRPFYSASGREALAQQVGTPR
jgi:hypothetical protein